MATLHVLHGLPGSGKSTFAQGLAQRVNGLTVANDQWMNVLFPEPCARDQYLDHFNKIEEIQLTVARRALECGIDVIWDYGVWTRHSRQKLVQSFSQVGCRLQFYSFECQAKIADSRVLRRDTRKHPSHSLNQPALDLFRSMFEPISVDEGLDVTIIKTDDR